MQKACFFYYHQYKVPGVRHDSGLLRHQQRQDQVLFLGSVAEALKNPHPELLLLIRKIKLSLNLCPENAMKKEILDNKHYSGICTPV